MVIWVKLLQTEKIIEIQLVRLTDVCGKVLSEKNAYKSVKTALLLSNVIDADHQNSCLFTNKGHFSSPLNLILITSYPYDNCAACCVLENALNLIFDFV